MAPESDMACRTAHLTRRVSNAIVACGDWVRLFAWTMLAQAVVLVGRAIGVGLIIGCIDGDVVGAGIVVGMVSTLAVVAPILLEMLDATTVISSSSSHTSSSSS